MVGGGGPMVQFDLSVMDRCCVIGASRTGCVRATHIVKHFTLLSKNEELRQVTQQILQFTLHIELHLLENYTVCIPNLYSYYEATILSDVLVISCASGSNMLSCYADY